VVLGAFIGLRPASAEVSGEISSMISLNQTVHFTASDGSLVPISPGDYIVAPGDQGLRLSRSDGEPVDSIIASSASYKEKVTHPISVSFGEEGAENADIHHIVLVLPDGYSLDAAGTYSGVTSRGLKERLAQRPLVQKAIQIKEAVQARVHEGLYGPPPPFNAGHNAVRAVFQENATGYVAPNTYVLTYLTTLIYPEFLDQVSGDPLKENLDYVTRLHKSPQDFVEEYAKHTHHLFWNQASPPGPDNVLPQYVWVWGSRGGQDPEAMVISTPKTVFVVFRGTDRVAAAKKQIGYEFAEWVQTNFVAVGVAPDVPPLRGLVHAGFWASLTAPATLYAPAEGRIPAGIANGLPFREATMAVIRAFGGAQKKLWISGHSLGAAHAQLYAAYLTANGLPPQGVNAIAGPHVGDSAFVSQLNAMFPSHRLQRLEFIHDPVTKVPPNVPLPQTPGAPPITFARAGTRVYYDDVKSIQFGAPERAPAEAQRMAMLLAAPLPLTRIFAAGDFCYHYPHWHLNAAYAQLAPSIVRQVPSPLLTPVMRGNIYSGFCGPPQVTRGNISPATAKRMILPGQ
jgi:hypothetical protein